VSAFAIRLRGYSGRNVLVSARRQPLAAIGVVIAVAWLLIAIFAPLIAPYGSLA